MKKLIALGVALVLSGCSTLRFAYDNADVYVRWKIDSYVTLQGEEADELAGRIAEFHSWHRLNELPRYARLAREASPRLAGGLSRQDMVWGYDSLRVRAGDSVRKAAEMLAPLLDRLTPEQVAQIERRVAEENRQFHRDHLRGAERERRRKRAKLLVDRLEDWVGKLSQAQVERVREFAERVPLLDELRDRDRKRLQDEVLAIIRAKESRKQLASRVAQWERGREPAFVAGLETWRAQFYTLLGDIDRSLTPEQRARGVAHLRRYAEEFDALAAQ